MGNGRRTTDEQRRGKEAVKNRTKGGSAIKSPQTSVYFHPSGRLVILTAFIKATTFSLCMLSPLPTKQNFHIRLRT